MSRTITLEEARIYEIGAGDWLPRLCGWLPRLPWLRTLVVQWYVCKARSKWARYAQYQALRPPSPAPQERRKGIILAVGTIHNHGGELRFDGWRIEPAGSLLFEPSPEGPRFYGSIPELFEITRRPSEFLQTSA